MGGWLFGVPPGVNIISLVTLKTFFKHSFEDFIYTAVCAYAVHMEPMKLMKGCGRHCYPLLPPLPENDLPPLFKNEHITPTITNLLMNDS